MSDIISLGFATFVRQSGTSMMSTLVNNLLRFYGGSLVIAAYGMIIRLMIFIMMPMFGLVHGFQPIAGYNYGARNFQRVRSVLATSVLMATLFASLCWLFIMMGPTQILSVFSRDQELLAIASPALKMVMAALPLVGLQVIGSTLFSGQWANALLQSSSPSQGSLSSSSHFCFSSRRYGESKESGSVSR